MLFVGTGNALYYSLNDGGNWKQLQTGPAGTRRSPGSWCRSRRTTWCSPRTAAASTSWKTSRRWSRAMMEADTAARRARSWWRRVRHIAWCAAGARAVQLLAEGGAEERRSSSKSWMPKGALVTQAASGHRPRGSEPRVAGTCATSRRALVALRTTPPENPHIWEEPRFQGQDDARHHALGPGAGRGRPDRRARASTP